MAGTGIGRATDPTNDNKSTTERMKITVLTGSPRRNGNSTYLAEQFIKGAEEQGHEVFRFDCAFRQVEPCRACNRCGMDGPCISNDDFQELRPHLIGADMVVFATPMYYFGFSAQMKRVIDRFYAINGQIRGVAKKRLSDDLRRHLPERGGADPAPLPDADGLSRMDKRGRSGGAGSVDGRQRTAHGLSAAGLSAGQELVIIYQQTE